MNNPSLPYVIGLMSGTSMDGVDAALIRTDGLDVQHTNQFYYLPYDEAFRTNLCHIVAQRGAVDTAQLHAAERALTLHHAQAVHGLLAQAGIVDVSLIGFHGHTIDHQPAKQISWQMGDAALLAQETGINVIDDFRMPDVLAGGQGAPLVPIYQHALLGAHAPKNAVLNIGGVANITFFPSHKPEEMIAFDTGPGNAMLDDWMRHCNQGAYDKNGALARTGTAEEEAVARACTHPYVLQTPPKSLDRNDFSWQQYVHANTDPANGAATLTEITAATLATSLTQLGDAAGILYITGGGRKNGYLMECIAACTGWTVKNIDSLGLNGDSLEAEAFAYLAARKQRGLAYSFSGTTGRQ